MQALNYAEGEK